MADSMQWFAFVGVTLPLVLELQALKVDKISNAHISRLNYAIVTALTPKGCPFYGLPEGFHIVSPRAGLYIQL